VAQALLPGNRVLDAAMRRKRRKPSKSKRESAEAVEPMKTGGNEVVTKPDPAIMGGKPCMTVGMIVEAIAVGRTISNPTEEE
jgi:hypothetical protein